MLRNEAVNFRGPIESDGTYTIEGVVDGDYQVAVMGVTDRDTTGDTGDTGAEGGGSEPKEGEHDEEGAGSGNDYMDMGEEAVLLIDTKYTNPTTSGLTITVPGGDYNITVDRASGAGAPAGEGGDPAGEGGDPAGEGSS